MAPTPGRIVHYVLSEDDAVAISRRRAAGAGRGPKWPAGAQAHVGNPVHAGLHVPAIVCAAWPHEDAPGLHRINAQAFLDGSDSLWVTSAPEGLPPGSWHWPEPA